MEDDTPFGASGVDGRCVMALTKPPLARNVVSGVQSWFDAPCGRVHAMAVVSLDPETMRSGKGAMTART
jgi:hypothetical protein